MAAALESDQVESSSDNSSTRNDNLLLEALGKKPELKRVYNFWTLCAYQVMIQCSWSCPIVLYSTIFDIGGPLSLVYGTLIVAVGQTLLVCSLAEYCSIWPTAGGQQYYTQVVSPPRLRPFLSYTVGWVLVIGEVSTGASSAINSANIIRSFVEITNPDYVWKPWLTWIVYSIFVTWPVAFTLFPSWLPAVNIVGAFWTLAGAAAWAIVFGVMAPKQDATFVFQTFMNNSGYTSNGWVFIMSFLTPIYALFAVDGVMHLVEEMKDASKEAPRVLVWSTIFCSITLWLAALLMMFCAGDYETYLQATQPYMNWFIDVVKSTYGGGVFCALVMMGLNFFIIVASVLAASRILWSMARDKGLPYSEYLAVVSNRFGVPFRSIVTVLMINFVLGLLVFGSDLAFQSLVSSAAILLQIGYLTPVLIVLYRGRKVLPPRPYFDLGRWGLLVNMLSVVWTLISIAVLVSPLYMPVDVENIGNMNWSILILGATIIFPGMYWIYAARHKYIKHSNTVMDEAVVVRNDSPPVLVKEVILGKQ